MKNRYNSYDRTGSSNDFSNNEGYHNYQDRTERSFRNAPQYANKQKDESRSDRQGFRNERSDYRSDYRAGSSGYSPSQNRSEWNRPSLQNSDRFESQSQPQYGYTASNSSDASMYGSEPSRPVGSQWGQDSQHWDTGSQFGANYGQGSAQSDRFDARNNGNYGYGSYNSSPRQGYEGSRFGQGQSDGQQSSNASGNFSWQSPERKSGLHTGKGPKGYRRSDERIREEINDTLSAHSEIDASEIEVDVKESIVTLSGTVESRQIKRLVEDTVEAVSGVQDVKNDLRVMASIESSTSSRSTGQTKTNLAGRQSPPTGQSTSSKSVQ